MCLIRIPFPDSDMNSKSPEFPRGNVSKAWKSLHKQFQFTMKKEKSEKVISKSV
jgi:hypothetical protein